MPTVLLIEDDVESRKKVARLFHRHGWDVLEALEGKPGIELAFAKRPDAVVCDLLLPGMSGLQVARAIREKLDLARIIIMAGRRYDIDRDAVLEARHTWTAGMPEGLRVVTRRQPSAGEWEALRFAWRGLYRAALYSSGEYTPALRSNA